MKSNLLFLFLPVACAGLISCTGGSSKNVITLETLLDEMVSVEKQACFPDPSYVCLQESSYDRRSVSPGMPGWFANSDGFGIIAVDTVDGRVERVMFDAAGPGVITRIWITTTDKRGTWRFYLDGAETPGLTIPAYDLMELNIPGAGRGFIQPHTSYTPGEGRGGATSFFPIPYAASCRITFEEQPGARPAPRYYQINYRKYRDGVAIETFSPEAAEKARKKTAEVNSLLLHPDSRKLPGETVEETKRIEPSGSLTVDLPEGENAVYEIRFSVNIADTARYGQAMQELVFMAEFDGRQTVQVPLSDYSGGGAGAPYVESWYLSSDGRGNAVSRWLMPYRRTARLTLLNRSSLPVGATLQVRVDRLKWHRQSLYFHASRKEEKGIYMHNNPEEDGRCTEWNVARIRGKGVYKGDLLSLYNHAPRWYGEGDEKIWIDSDTFPSHFGTGTEDYYNSSWAPVIPFHTPFGGAPRADEESSHGYNAFFRTRHLDGIPFREKFRFDIEMLSWDGGFADYAATVFWYGED
ncbi:MAG: DUF2961 domain-containing protein [Tannerella sp.]|nr:DUF2961 domain-containing protein [Tannerella sp.]